MSKQSFETRYWLLYQKGEYYIKEGYKSNLVTNIIMWNSVVIKSIKTSNRSMAYKILIATAWEHFRSVRKQTDKVD